MHLTKLVQTSTKRWKWPCRECHRKLGNGVWGRTRVQARACWGTAVAVSSSPLHGSVPGDAAPWPLWPSLHWRGGHRLPAHSQAAQNRSEKRQSGILPIWIVIILSYLMYVDVSPKEFPRENKQNISISLCISKLQHCSAPTSSACLQATSVPAAAELAWGFSVVNSRVGSVVSNLSH